MKRRLLMPVLLLFAIWGTLRAFEDAEQTVDRADLPAAVSAKLKATFPTAKLLEIEQETEDGGMVYELELNIEGIELEVEFDPSGKILEIEVDQDDKDQPDED